MEAQNEETGQRAAWLMTAEPGGDRQAFDEAFNDMIWNGRGEADARPGLTASEKESLTAEPVLYSLEDVFNNPAGSEKLPDSLLALLASRPCAEVTVEVTKIYIEDDCDSMGSGEWHLDVFIGGTKKEKDWSADTGSWYDLNWTVDVALADDSATVDFDTDSYEEDTTFNDDLPDEQWSHGSSDNWGVGQTSSDSGCGARPADPSTNHCRDLGPSDGCEYYLYYNLEFCDDLT